MGMVKDGIDRIGGKGAGIVAIEFDQCPDQCRPTAIGGGEIVSLILKTSGNARDDRAQEKEKNRRHKSKEHQCCRV